MKGLTEWVPTSRDAYRDAESTGVSVKLTGSSWMGAESRGKTGYLKGGYVYTGDYARDRYTARKAGNFYTTC